MRLFLIASGLLATISVGPAFAADEMVEIPVENAGYNWSGVYVGVQGGYGWGQADIVNEGVAYDADLDGGFGGGHVAALWQFDRFVAGIEGEANYAGLDGRVGIPEAAGFLYNPGSNGSAP
jgi:outer membrane immunogenic protein